jgi:6-pyruvoyl-tetrahydropterin synthase
MRGSKTCCHGRVLFGFLISICLSNVKDLIKSELEDRFDHRNLNLDCPEFADLIPTAENISVVCYNLLRSKLDSKYDLTTVNSRPRGNILSSTYKISINRLSGHLSVSKATDFKNNIFVNISYSGSCKKVTGKKF